jgi:hypothetical protein
MLKKRRETAEHLWNSPHAFSCRRRFPCRSLGPVAGAPRASTNARRSHAARARRASRNQGRRQRAPVGGRATEGGSRRLPAPGRSAGRPRPPGQRQPRHPHPRTARLRDADAQRIQPAAQADAVRRFRHPQRGRPPAGHGQCACLRTAGQHRTHRAERGPGLPRRAQAARTGGWPRSTWPTTSASSSRLRCAANAAWDGWWT